MKRSLHTKIKWINLSKLSSQHKVVISKSGSFYLFHRCYFSHFTALLTECHIQLIVIVMSVFLLDHPQHSAAISQDKLEDTGLEDIYGYDCPRPIIPPAPTRRAISEITGPSAAFSALSIDGAVEASTCLY